MERIESNWRIGNDWRIRYRYYLDGNELWFNYNDICEYLNVGATKFTNKYFDSIPNYNKRTFEDNNNSSNRYERTPFINKVAYDEFVVHEIERANMMECDMRLLISELGLPNNSSFGAKYEIGNLLTELSKNDVDIDKIKEYTQKLFATPEIQDIVNTKYHSDKVREYNNWLNDGNPENNMFIAHKENNEIYTYIGPSIDEALDILYKASLE